MGNKKELILLKTMINIYFIDEVKRTFFRYKKSAI